MYYTILRKHRHYPDPLPFRQHFPLQAILVDFDDVLVRQRDEGVFQIPGTPESSPLALPFRKKKAQENQRFPDTQSGQDDIMVVLP